MIQGRIARWSERVILGRIMREVIKFLLDMGGDIVFI
jgi:hypothetical protein